MLSTLATVPNQAGAEVLVVLDDPNASMPYAVRCTGCPGEPPTRANAVEVATQWATTHARRCRQPKRPA